MRRKIGTSKRKRASVSGVKKTHRKRRRSISGISNIKGMVLSTASVIGGAILAREANALLIKPVFKVSDTISGVIQVAGGLALQHFVKGEVAKDIGLGMMANGGMVAIVSLSKGALAGTNRASYRINGAPSTSGLNVLGSTSSSGISKVGSVKSSSGLSRVGSTNMASRSRGRAAYYGC